MNVLQKTSGPVALVPCAATADMGFPWWRGLAFALWFLRMAALPQLAKALRKCRGATNITELWFWRPANAMSPNTIPA